MKNVVCFVFFLALTAGGVLLGYRVLALVAGLGAISILLRGIAQHRKHSTSAAMYPLSASDDWHDHQRRTFQGGDRSD